MSKLNGLTGVKTSYKLDTANRKRAGVSFPFEVLEVVGGALALKLTSRKEQWIEFVPAVDMGRAIPEDDGEVSFFNLDAVKLPKATPA
ncbi:hypothetical protein [Ensifer sp. ZNC0028]|uniref:hypothetical protein n=1 Tax=Ensifer sp. ZNC0028 TaxID=1339236 RepID=UPI0005BE421A|nr:hypothetical protein [Ensifer sp. ZNC0028]